MVRKVGSVVGTMSVVAPLLAACGGSSATGADADPLTPPPGTTVPATTPPDTTMLPVTSTSTSTSTSVVETAPPGPPPDPSCLEGDWVIDEAELNGYYGAFGENATAVIGGDGAGADFELELDLTGEASLLLDGSSFVYAVDFDLTLAVAGLEGVGGSEGTLRGTYTVDDGRITAESDGSDEAGLGLEVEVGGVVMTGADLSAWIYDGVPFDGAGFSCDGPTIAFQASADPSVRHDVVLRPR